MAYTSTRSNNDYQTTVSGGKFWFQHTRRYTTERQLPVNLAALLETPHQQTYSGANIGGPIMNLLRMRSQKSGTITGFYIWTTGAIGGSLTADFNLYVNGVGVFGPGDKLTLTDAVTSGAKAVSKPVQFGDVLEVGIDSYTGPGTIQTPVTAMVIVR